MDPTHITTILIADDDPSHLLLAEAALGGAGFVVHTVNDGEEAVRQFEPTQPDCVILDVNMPKMTGIEVCRRIRERADGRLLPILMLTGRNDIVSISDAFAAGASDFAQKGMNPRLLVERVKAVLRRAGAKDGTAPVVDAAKVIERGKLAMDPDRHSCTWDSRPVTLTVTEFLILQSLAQRPGIVKSRDALMDAAYDDQVYVDDRTIDSHIKRLRKKFNQVDEAFDGIETLYGVGYRFKEQ